MDQSSVVTSLSPNAYIVAQEQPEGQAARTVKIKVSDFLNAVTVADTVEVAASPPVTDDLLALIQGFWNMEELAGTRYSAYGNSHLLESAAIGNTAGRAGIGLAADFSGGELRWLITDLPELTWADMAINFHAKMVLPVERADVVTLCPRQTTRRTIPRNGPGNYMIIAVVKVGGNYHFRFDAGTLQANGGGSGWFVVSSVNISANTYYQVLAYTYTDFATGVKTVNISVNNTLTTVTTHSFQFLRHHAPTLYVGDNPLADMGTARAVNLAVDSLAVWYRGFSAQQRQTLYNEGRGWDPTRALINGDNVMAFWPMDEAAGLTRADLMGRYPLLDPNGAVAQAEGTHEEAADFAGATTSFLHTQAPLYDWRGIAVAGFVKFDSAGVTRPFQLLIDWLAGDEEIYGFRLYYADGDGFVFEIGNGTGATVKVETGDDPEIVADQWYFVAAGASYQGFGGTIWVARDAATPVSLTSFPSPHNVEALNLFFGRDAQGSGGSALDGKMDCWGMYRALTANDLSIIRQYKCYPF